MPPVPRRQARTSSPPDLPRTAGSALRTQQVSAPTQGAALHPPASLPEDKATSAAWLGSLSPPRKHRRRRMSRRRGPGRCSACCRLGSVLQQCQCSLPGHLRGRGGASPHLLRGTSGSHNLPELQPQGHKPQASSVAEGEMFQVPFSAVKKVHRPAGPGAERGACAGRRGPRGCFSNVFPPARLCHALLRGRTDRGRWATRRGLLPG